MKWFKHISDSLDDPFIFDLMTEFGSDGYVVFFGIIEIYSREFKTEVGWNLSITRSYLKQKLRKRQDTLIVKSLEHIKNSGKWEVEFNGEQVTIFIPKFRELLDEWTLRKLGSKSGVAPKILSADTDKELDTDKEEDIKPLPDPDKSAPCPHQEIIDLYHKLLPELPQVKIWTPKRQGYLRSRWNEDKSRQNLPWWEKYFLKIKQSPFLTGNVTDFKASLEWVVNQSNMVKILEGKYDGGGNGTNARTNTNRQYGRNAEIPDSTTAALARLEEEYERSISAASRNSRGTPEGDDVPHFESAGS